MIKFWLSKMIAEIIPYLIILLVIFIFSMIYLFKNRKR